MTAGLAVCRTVEGVAKPMPPWRWRKSKEETARQTTYKALNIKE